MPEFSIKIHEWCVILELLQTIQIFTEHRVANINELTHKVFIGQNIYTNFNHVITTTNFFYKIINIDKKNLIWSDF